MMLKYIFYRLYLFFKTYHRVYLAEMSAAGVIFIVHFIYFLTLLLYKPFGTLVGKIMLPQMGIVIFIFVGIQQAHMIYFSPSLAKQLSQKYRKETAKSRRIGTIITFVYVVGSLILLAGTLYFYDARH